MRKIKLNLNFKIAKKNSTKIHRLKSSNKTKKGFSLVELIVVISIMAILSALTLPKFLGIQEDAKYKADVSNAKIIHDTAVICISNNTDNINEKISSSIESEIPTSADEVIKIIEESLSSTPKPKSSKENFIISIDKNKNIKVMLEGMEIYPDTQKYLANN